MYTDTFFSNLSTFLIEGVIFVMESKKGYDISTDNEQISYENDFTHGIKKIYTCFRQKVEDGFNFKGEMHDYWEMVYVINGFVYVSEEGKIYKLTEGDLIFHKPMEFHRIWCENSPTARFMVISFSNDDKLLTPLGDGVVKLNIEKQEKLENIYRAFTENFNVNLNVMSKNDSKGSNLIKEKMSILELELFLLSLVDAEKNSESRQHTIGAHNYKLIIDTMTENINENLTIEDLAKLCNLSVSNLKKTFGKYNSGGVIKYFNRMRIKRAIKFLRDGYSISTVSREMGFSSQNYFSVIFKRETGMLPSEFKKKDL